MNDIDPIGGVPPPIPPSGYGAAGGPGQTPEEREPIRGPAAAVDAILRQPRRVMFQLREGSLWLPIIMIGVALFCSLVYGVVVGTFSGGDQLWMAPVKTTAGLFLSALICLPSLYIFACLSGSQARLAEIFGLVMGLLMLTTILLIGFAPVAWLFSQSTDSIAWMGTLHLLFWGIATVFGLRFVERAFLHSRARSSAGLNTWALIFILVVFQMTTALRPIVGTADTFLPTEKKFFLIHWGESLKAPHDESR